MVIHMNFALANKKFVNIVFILIAISFLWFGTFGLLQHMVEMKSDSIMNGCLFNGQTEVCAMNFSEHITTWQSMLTSLPQDVGLLAMLILAVISITIIFFWRNFISEISESITSRSKLYIKQFSQIQVFNSLREAFSQGILNPKIYNSII